MPTVYNWQLRTSSTSLAGPAAPLGSQAHQMDLPRTYPHPAHAGDPLFNDQYHLEAAPGELHLYLYRPDFPNGHPEPLHPARGQFKALGPTLLYEIQAQSSNKPRKILAQGGQLWGHSPFGSLGH